MFCDLLHASASIGGKVNLGTSLATSKNCFDGLEVFVSIRPQGDARTRLKAKTRHLAGLYAVPLSYPTHGAGPVGRADAITAMASRSRL